MSGTSRLSEHLGLHTFVLSWKQWLIAPLLHVARFCAAASAARLSTSTRCRSRSAILSASFLAPLCAAGFPSTACVGPLRQLVVPPPDAQRPSRSAHKPEPQRLAQLQRVAQLRLRVVLPPHADCQAQRSSRLAHERCTAVHNNRSVQGAHLFAVRSAMCFLMSTTFRACTVVGIEVGVRFENGNRCQEARRDSSRFA